MRRRLEFRAWDSVFAPLPMRARLGAVQEAVFGAEGDHNTFRLHSLRFSICVQPACAGQRFDTGEVNVLAAFAAKASFQQFVAPFGVAKSGARAGDGSITGMAEPQSHRGI